jgi:hypothetical protein
MVHRGCSSRKRVALILVVFYDAESCDLIAQDHDARAG